MPIYISRGRFTSDAVKGMVAKPENREEAVSKLFESVGGDQIAEPVGSIIAADLRARFINFAKIIEAEVLAARAERLSQRADVGRDAAGAALRALGHRALACTMRNGALGVNGRRS